MELNTQYGLKTLVRIPAGNVELEGELVIPPGVNNVVIFSHGSGSSRLSPRNNFVAKVLQKNNIGTLLIDLLTRAEDEIYENRFNINHLTERLNEVTKWITEQPELMNFKIGYFGASTGAASALKAAAKLGNLIKAVVSRGGRPDLAMSVLEKVQAPTLLIVGGKDYQVIELNQQAYNQLKTEKKMNIIPGATHLFEEPGALEKVADIAADWFVKHL